MIKADHVFNDTVDCQIYGPMKNLEVEFNAVVVGYIKTLRHQNVEDDNIEKMLVEHIATAFKIVDLPGGIKDV